MVQLLTENHNPNLQFNIYHFSLNQLSWSQLFAVYLDYLLYHDSTPTCPIGLVILYNCLYVMFTQYWFLTHFLNNIHLFTIFYYNHHLIYGNKRYFKLYQHLVRRLVYYVECLSSELWNPYTLIIVLLYNSFYGNYLILAIVLYSVHCTMYMQQSHTHLKCL